MSMLKACRNHPAVQAEYSCHSCLAPICDECVRTTDAGAIICPKCESRAPSPGSSDSALETPSAAYELAARAYEPPEPGEWSTATQRRALPSFGRCANHPNSAAVQVCANCRSPICDTCDFEFPGDIHLCPACATNPKQGLSPKRKKMATASLVLAGINTIGSGAVIILPRLAGGPANQESLQLLGCVILVILIAGIAGSVTGFSAFRTRSQNPLFLWIGPILNGLIALIWIGLIIVGNLR